MKLTKEQSAVALTAVSYIDSNHKLRTFPPVQLKDAGLLAHELREKCTEKLENEQFAFKEGEVELTTSQKALLIHCLEREWTAFDGLVVVELKTLLEA